MTKYLNPPTLGQTPNIEAYRIGHCPTCDWPAVSVVESAEGDQRRIDCRCGRGHPWTTIWPGQTRMIHRRPYGPGITCPRCGRTSFHPRDAEEGYCGHCRDWTMG